MKLLVLADIHGYLGHLNDIETVIGDCDAIVIAGDITDFGGAEQARFIISSLSAYGKPLLAVPGNCDLPGAEKELHQKHISLHGRHHELGGLWFVGAGGSLTPGAAQAEAGEEHFRKLLKQGISGLDFSDNLVLVTHQPAREVRVDFRDTGRHAGSWAIREFIERYRPILAISGHIHEARGVDHLDATTLLNPGPFREGKYAVACIEDGKVQVQLYP